MIRIINGRRYDTDASHLIGEATHGEFVTDHSYWRAGLYRTPRAGRYFLAGEGGPMTQFARIDGDGRSLAYGERVIPMDAHDAREWAERHLTSREVERAFEIEEA